TAVEGAPAGCFNHIDLTTEYCVTAQHSRAAVGGHYFTVLQSIHRPVRRVIKPVAASIRKPIDMVKAAFNFDCPQQFTKSNPPLTPHYEIHNARGSIGGRFRGEAWIIPSNRNPYVGSELPHKVNDSLRCPALKCH